MAALITAQELAQLLDLEYGADPVTDAGLDQVAQAADIVVRRYLDTAVEHDTHANDREAAGAVGVQIWTSRMAPGGTMVNLDYQALSVPHLLGPGLVARVMGLIGPCRRYGGLVVA